MNETIKEDIVSHIATLYKADQLMRHSDEWDSEIDEHNTDHLKKIIDAYGYIGITVFAEETAFQAFILALHADHDITFQKRVLALMCKALRNKDTKPQWIAYLVDRILSKERNVQFYGTQVVNNTLTNRNELVPIVQERNVNKRRKKMDMSPLDTYLKEFEL